MKALLMTLAIVLAGTFAACDKPGYKCEGEGTCESPRCCVHKDDVLDTYCVVDGREFDNLVKVAAYCADKKLN